MSYEKRDFANCSGPDKLASHRLHGTHATPDQPATAEPIDAGFAPSPPQLFQGMAFDPAKAPFDFRTRHFSPTLEMWAQHKPYGYVDGVDAYLFASDESSKPVNPLGD